MQDEFEIVSAAEKRWKQKVKGQTALLIVESVGSAFRSQSLVFSDVLIIQVWFNFLEKCRAYARHRVSRWQNAECVVKQEFQYASTAKRRYDCWTRPQVLWIKLHFRYSECFICGKNRTSFQKALFLKGLQEPRGSLWLESYLLELDNNCLESFPPNNINQAMVTCSTI